MGAASTLYRKPRWWTSLRKANSGEVSLARFERIDRRTPGDDAQEASRCRLSLSADKATPPRPRGQCSI